LRRLGEIERHCRIEMGGEARRRKGDLSGACRA
jgi:hypothetical protein